jgi:uncharacterized protein (TIGR02996 family)
MTAQVEEGLRFRDRDTSMAACPLNGAFGPDFPRPAFAGTSSACWRGYVGRWEIRDNLLHLTDLRGQVRDTRAEGGRRTLPITLTDLFPHAPADGVFADWCIDWLPVRWGKQTRYVHMGFASEYDRELFLGVCGGYLIAVHDVTNGDPPQITREFTPRLDEVFPDHAPFVRAIHVNWADQLPRLVYADWLDERNDPRGELLRVDVEVAKSPGDDALLARRATVLETVKDWFWMKLVGCDPPRDKYGWEQRTW